MTVGGKLPTARRRGRAALGLVAMAVGAGLLLITPEARAAGFDAAGWWSRTVTTNPASEIPAAVPVPPPTAPATLPGTPDVGPGQLLVQGTPEGAVAIAAAKWTLSGQDSKPTVELPIATGSVVQASSVILACKAAVPWEPPAASPGSWDSKPLVDGFKCVPGQIDAGVTKVSFDLQGLVSGPTLSVVFVPGQDPALPVEANGSAFRWILPTPASDTLSVIPGGTTSVTTPGSSQTPMTVASSPLSSSAFGASDLRSSSFDGSTIGPSFDTGGGAVGSIATPALEPQDLAPSVPQLDEVVPAAAKSVERHSRTIGVVLLLLGAAAAAWSWYDDSQAEGTTVAIGLGRFRTVVPVPPRRSIAGAPDQPFEIGLGRFRRTVTPAEAAVVASSPATPAGPGQPVVGGLGRFARPRTEAPPKIG